VAYIYKIHHLPTSEPSLVPFLAGKFASLGLSALTVSAAASDFAIPESGGPPLGDAGDRVESKWPMTAVYTSPTHRGQGVAKMLIRAALGFAGVAVEGADHDPSGECGGREALQGPGLRGCWEMYAGRGVSE
jgi:GNAT superfamily N-acetyltransferase